MIKRYYKTLLHIPIYFLIFSIIYILYSEYILYLAVFVPFVEHHFFLKKFYCPVCYKKIWLERIPGTEEYVLTNPFPKKNCSKCGEDLTKH